MDIVGVTFESAQGLSGLHIPQFDSVVAAPTSEDVSIRTESHAIDMAGVTFGGVPELSSLHIPQFDSVVVAPTSEDVSIRTESHASDGLCMAQ